MKPAIATAMVAIPTNSASPGIARIVATASGTCPPLTHSGLEPGCDAIAQYPPTVVADALDTYCNAWVARGRHELVSEPTVLNAPGVRGVAVIRLLVSDDSGYDRLVEEVVGPWRSVVFVFDRAPRSSEFMRGQPGWNSSEQQMAMVLNDIDAVTGATLPDGLSVRPVDRPSFLAPDGVSVTDAATVAIASDLTIPDGADDVAAFLSGLPPSVRVFAAVDEEGVAHATAACHVFGEYAQVFFVNTEPAWRRRGIGQAMTVAALRAAASLGARQALLHATDFGISVYQLIGFDPVGLLTRYSRAD